MWLHRFSDYILEKRFYALLITFAIAFIPIIGTFAILIAAFITLVKGIYDGALFTIAATIPYVITFFLSLTPGQPVPLVLWAAIGVAVISNVLTWAFACMLERQTSWRTMLEVGALLGVFAISILHLVYPHIGDWWGKELQNYYLQGANLLKGMPANSPEVQLEAINRGKNYATGIMTAAIILNAFLQLIIARWWQAALFMPGKLSEELHDIRLTPLAGILFVASLVLSYLGNSVVLDIMPILYLLFGAAGLSLIHYLFGLMNSTTVWFWLIFFYFVVIISLPSSVIMISFIGLIDVWFDTRNRLKKMS